jgi:hypothetical protein
MRRGRASGLVLAASLLVLSGCSILGLGSPASPALSLLGPLPAGDSVVFNRTLPDGGNENTLHRDVLVVSKNSPSSEAATTQLIDTLKKRGWKFDSAGYGKSSTTCLAVGTPSFAFQGAFQNSGSSHQYTTTVDSIRSLSRKTKAPLIAVWMSISC